MSKYLMNKLIHLVNMDEKPKKSTAPIRASSSKSGRKPKS